MVFEVLVKPVDQNYARQFYYLGAHCDPCDCMDVDWMGPLVTENDCIASHDVIVTKEIGANRSS